jgi:HlyD family secretion protein
MATSETPRRPLPRHPKVWWSRIKVKWPILVWLGAVWLAWTLYQAGPPSTDFLGVYSVVEERAGPVDTARLVEVPVEVGQWVEPGTVLARFDTSSLDAELVVERLRLERQFTQLVQDADTALRAARLEQARDEAELAALNAEFERLTALRERNLVDEQELARVRVPREALARALEMYPDYLAGLDAQYQEALRLRENAGAWLDAEAAPAGGSMPEIRSAYTLRAQSAGRVGSIYYHAGSVVPAGEPVVTVIRDGPPTVLGFMMESELVDLQPGQTVYVTDIRGRAAPVEGTVTSLSPHIGPMPVLSPRSTTDILRGRQVTIALGGQELSLTPGSAVRISVGAAARNDPIDAIRTWLAAR